MFRSGGGFYGSKKLGQSAGGIEKTTNNITKMLKVPSLGVLLGYRVLKLTTKSSRKLSIKKKKTP